jgi:hypothetical protein
MSNGHARAARWRTVAVLGVCAAALVVVAGCGGAGSGTGSGSTTGGTSGGTTIATGPPGGTPVDGPVVIVPDSIPDGRTITSGGGNPEYTFRSLWKKALPEALKWKGDAYLAYAYGGFVNNDGVPSEWTLLFRTHASGANDLQVWIDPWGKVTRTEESAPTDVRGVRAVMPDIIDSDEAVAKALPALAEKVDPAKTRDPRLVLGFRDGAGPFWYYIVVENSSGNYVTVTMDALTGSITGVK